MKVKFITLLSCYGLFELVGGGILRAQLIAYDPFALTTGALAGRNDGTWPAANQNYTSANFQVTNGSLSYGSLLTSGNSLQSLYIYNVTGVSNDYADRPLGTTLGGAGTTYWISYLTNSGNYNGLTLYSGGTGYNGGTSGTMLVDIGHWDLEIGAASGHAATIVNYSSVPTYTQTNFIVAQLVLSGTGSSTINVWVDPDPSSLATGASPTGGIFTSVTGFNAFTFDTVSFGKLLGTTQSFYDELRIGYTWADVSPVSAIPEPSTWAMTMGLCSLLCAFLAKRKSDSTTS